MKKLVFISASFFLINTGFSQTCEVSVAAIQGKYTGGCKKDKAEGTGKSEGTDTYDGNFKGGYPSGEGVYTYKNGDNYTGTFKRGLKDGKGEFHYKKGDNPDSIITGYWKNDQYIGEYLHPFEILTKSAGFSRLEIKPEVGQPNIVKIISENTIKMNSLVSNTPPPMPVIDQLTAQEGNYSREEQTTVDKKSILILHDVVFPLRFKAVYHTDSFEAVIYKPGNYSIIAQISARD